MSKKGKMNLWIITVLTVLIFVPGIVRADESLSDRVDILEKYIESNTDTISSLVDLAGYYDFTFVDNSKDGLRNNGVFRQHHLSLFFGRQIQKFRFFSEVEMEYGPKIDIEAGSIAGGTDKAEILVETAWLEYNYSDLLNVRTGKHLTPYGWWNKNHYPILVYTTSRPESSLRIFPNISTGIQLYGSTYFEDYSLDYNLYYINDLDNGATNKNDVGANKGVGGRIGVHLPFFDKFVLGISYLTGHKTTVSNNRYVGFDELIAAGPFELLSEFAYNDSQAFSSAVGDTIGSRIRQVGYYIQPSINISKIVSALNRFGELRIVYRFDFTDTDNTKTTSRDKSINTVGISYRPITNIAVKLEHNWYNAERATADRLYNEVQASVTMFF